MNATSSSSTPVPMMFLPGANGQAAFWDPVRDQFADQITDAIDWPGVGANEPDPLVKNYDDMASLVIRRLAGPSVLVAQSMGGVIATLVALRRPDLVKRIVFVATSGGVNVKDLGGATWGSTDTPEWVRDQRAELADRIPKITVPALLIWASNDLISPVAVGERLRSLLPDARLEVLESDDHWVAIEQADRVAELIRAFITG